MYRIGTGFVQDRHSICSLIAPVTIDSDIIQESQELGSVRRDAWSGTRDVSMDCTQGV